MGSLHGLWLADRCAVDLGRPGPRPRADRQLVLRASRTACRSAVPPCRAGWSRASGSLFARGVQARPRQLAGRQPGVEVCLGGVRTRGRLLADDPSREGARL